jgi:hypothetical protein
LSCIIFIVLNRLAEIQTDIILAEENRDMNEPKVMKAVLKACEVSALQ